MYNTYTRCKAHLVCISIFHYCTCLFAPLLKLQSLVRQLKSFLLRPRRAVCISRAISAEGQERNRWLGIHRSFPFRCNLHFHRILSADRRQNNGQIQAKQALYWKIYEERNMAFRHYNLHSLAFSDSTV